MPIYKQQIRIAIVVIIKESQSPSAQKLSGCGDFARFIRERNVFLIVIKTEEFVVDVGDEEILPPIAVIIRGVDTHSRTRSSRLAKSNSGRQPNLLKLFALLVDEEKIRDCVVCHKEIQPTIVIDVRPDRTE